MNKLLELLEVGALDVPWPCVIDGKVFNGGRVRECDICIRKCVDKQCRAFDPKDGPQECHKYLTYYQKDVRNHQIIVYGIVGTDRSSLPKTRFYKSATKRRFVSWEEFLEWCRRVQSFVDRLERFDKEAISHALDPLHDPKRWAEQIRQIAEKLLLKDGHRDVDEALEHAEREEKSLFKASEFLVKAFDAVVIYFNPAAATFGGKSDVEIYRLVDKIRMIIDLSEQGRGHRVNISGRSYKAYKLYDSISLMIFALLNNAAKYCVEGQIDILFAEDAQGTKVTIESIGPLIEEEEKAAIFKRSVRGKWAAKIEPQGSGVGLYIAGVIAKAHQIELSVDSEPMRRKKKGAPLALNKFWFVLRH